MAAELGYGYEVEADGGEGDGRDQRHVARTHAREDDEVERERHLDEEHT